MGNLPLAVRIHQYLATLAPHTREREAARLLAEAEEQLNRISEREFVMQARAAIMGGWIPVSERLPEHTDTVIVSDEHGVWFAHRDSKLGEWWADEGPMENVTHWIPLPEPPCCQDQTTPLGNKTHD